MLINHQQTVSCVLCQRAGTDNKATEDKVLAGVPFGDTNIHVFMHHKQHMFVPCTSAMNYK